MSPAGKKMQAAIEKSVKEAEVRRIAELRNSVSRGPARTTGTTSTSTAGPITKFVG